MRRVLIIFSILFSVAYIGKAQNLPEGYWKGELTYAGRHWDIAFRLSEEKNLKQCKFYSEALWRWDYVIDSVQFTNNEVTVVLPFEIGTFKAKISYNSWVGKVVIRNSKEEIPLSLTRQQLPGSNKRSSVITNGDVNLGATLFLPSGPGLHPLITIIHGGGDSGRDAPPIFFLANYFSNRGFSCLIYDKRGSGESTGTWKNTDFASMATDVTACMKWAIATDNTIDKKKIGLMAVSQGTWISSIVALNFPEIDYIINVAAPLSSPGVADTYALTNQLIRDNWTLQDIKERTELWNLSVDVTRHPGQEQYWNKLTQTTELYKEHSWFVKDPYNPPRKSWFRDWYKLVVDYDPVPVLEKLSIPILWMYGNRDTQSDFAANIGKLSFLQRTMKKNYSIEVYSDTGHGVMGPVDQFGNDLSPVTTPPDFFRTMVDWVKSQPSGK
jgi:pimeloyl-ACP methyl ester carboxylesterase